VKISSSEKGLSSCLFIPNIMIFMIFDIESHQKNLFLEKNWKKKLTWWTKKLHSAIHGKLPDGAHQADSDVLNLINIVAYSTLIKAFRKATPTPVAAIFEKVTKKSQRKRMPCTECGKKRHTAKNNCSLKKKKN